MIILLRKSLCFLIFFGLLGGCATQKSSYKGKKNPIPSSIQRDAQRDYRNYGLSKKLKRRIFNTPIRIK